MMRKIKYQVTMTMEQREFAKELAASEERTLSSLIRTLLADKAAEKGIEWPKRGQKGMEGGNQDEC